MKLSKSSSGKSATCLDFHLSMSDSAIMGSSRSSEPEGVIGVCSFGTITRKWKTWRLRAEHTGLPDAEFVAAPMEEEFSLPCPLDALF